MPSITIEDKPGVVIIQIIGELYHEKVSELERVWEDQLKKPAEIIAINCAGLTYIDSPAIGALVKFFNEAMQKKKKLVFFDLSPTIRSLFDNARLERLFTITSAEKFEKEYLKSR